MGGSHIRLNAVAPGATQTPLLQEGLDDPFVGPLIEGFAVPIGRRGKPEEIAALIEFLLGPDARFFCGSVVFCDGGTDAMTRADDIPPPWNPGDVGAWVHSTVGSRWSPAPARESGAPLC